MERPHSCVFQTAGRPMNLAPVVNTRPSVRGIVRAAWTWGTMSSLAVTWVSSTAARSRPRMGQDGDVVWPLISQPHFRSSRSNVNGRSICWAVSKPIVNKKYERILDARMKLWLENDREQYYLFEYSGLLKHLPMCVSTRFHVGSNMDMKRES